MLENEARERRKRRESQRKKQEMRIRERGQAEVSFVDFICKMERVGPIFTTTVQEKG